MKMKSNLNYLFIIFVLFVLFIGTNYKCFASDEIDIVPSQEMLDIELPDIPKVPDISSFDEENENNYFNLLNGDITLDKNISGDAFICCSGKVTINSSIAGNVFLLANDVEILNGANIGSDAFILSKNLKHMGNIGGNAFICSGDVSLEEGSYIRKDLYLTSNDLKLNSYIIGSANISVNNFSFLDKAVIERNLNYSSSKEISIPENAVLGKVTFIKSASEIEVNVKKTSIVKDFIFSALSLIVTSIVILIICRKLFAKFTDNNIQFTKNIGKYFLFGFISLASIPIISIVLLFTGITANLSIVLIALYLALILISSATSISAFSVILADKYKKQFAINDTLRQFIFIVVLVVLYKLLKMVPLIGTILTIFINILGFGFIIKSVFDSIVSKS